MSNFVKMNKALTTQDADMLRMVESLTDTPAVVSYLEAKYMVETDVSLLSEKERKALLDSIKGRMGERFMSGEIAGDCLQFFIDEDKAMNVEIAQRCEGEDEPDVTIGEKWIRKAGERTVVRALKVGRNNFEKLHRFVGGGVMNTPCDPKQPAMFFFVTANGTILEVGEGSWIVRNRKGMIWRESSTDFIREYERVPDASAGTQKLISLCDELYGTDLRARLEKLSEEYGELCEAARPFILGDSMDRMIQERMLDEMADLLAVLLHTASILGATGRDLVASALDKIEGRMTDPEYRREHPHKADCGPQEADENSK